LFLAQGLKPGFTHAPDAALKGRSSKGAAAILFSSSVLLTTLWPDTPAPPDSRGRLSPHNPSNQD